MSLLAFPGQLLLSFPASPCRRRSVSQSLFFFLQPSRCPTSCMYPSCHLGTGSWVMPLELRFFKAFCWALPFFPWWLFSGRHRAGQCPSWCRPRGPTEYPHMLEQRPPVASGQRCPGGPALGWAAMALGSTLLLFYEVGFHLLLRFFVFICELSFT